MDLIDFPPEFSEEIRIKTCRIIDDIVFKKDQQIQKLEDKNFDLDEKLGQFNGGLTWRQAEDLKQQMNIIQYENTAIIRELKNFNLRATRYTVDDLNPSRDGAIRPFDIKIEKITLRERFITWVKSLIKFELVRKS